MGRQFNIKTRTRCGAERIIGPFDKTPYTIYGSELKVPMTPKVPAVPDGDYDRTKMVIHHREFEFRGTREDDGYTFVYEEK